MNMYQLTGDIFHISSIVWLLIKLIKTKSCGGVSRKSQVLFAIVYMTRYLDLFAVFASYYNSIMKIIYTVCYHVIVLLMCTAFKKSYRHNEDTFITELLLVPSFALALWFNYYMTPIEILWAFSIYLEAVAILPQLYMIYKRGEVEKSLLYYLIPLGLYRLFYIFNWIYRYSTENHIDRIADTAGIVYVSIYLFALIEFCVLKIKVTNEENEKFLKSNIFFISNNEAYHEISNDEKSLSSEQPVEKV